MSSRLQIESMKVAEIKMEGVSVSLKWNMNSADGSPAGKQRKEYELIRVGATEP